MISTNNSYKIYYIPDSNNPPEDVGGFLTVEDAFDYIRKNHLCDICQKEYKAFLDGEKEDEEKGFFPSEFPACTFEWIVEEEWR